MEADRERPLGERSAEAGEVPTGPARPTDEYPQPVSEVVDPRDPEPLAERPRTEVAGHRVPRPDEDVGGRPAGPGASEPRPSAAGPSDEELEGYNDEQRKAFRATYQSALERFGEHERALAVAHAAARGTPGDR